MSSPDGTPELVQASFAGPTLQGSTSGLRSLADRARERRYAGLAQQQGGLPAVLEEEGKGHAHSESHPRLPLRPSPCLAQALQPSKQYRLGVHPVTNLVR